MANRFTKKTPSSAKQITKAKPKRKASTKSTSVKSTAKNKNKVKRNALHRLGGEYAKAIQEETKKPSKKTTKTKAKTKHKSTTKIGQAKRVEKPPNGGIPIGRTISTKDKYLTGWNPSKINKDRTIVVIDKNNDNELAIVRLSSEDKNKRGQNFSSKTFLKDYSKWNKNGKDTYFKHFVETKDNEKKPIKINDKFRANHKNMDVSQNEVELIKNKVLYHTKQASTNRKLIDELHNK